MLKILDIIGGMEEKKSIAVINSNDKEYYSAKDLKNKGFNACLTTPVVIDEEALAISLFEADGHNREHWNDFRIELQDIYLERAKTIAKALKQGKIIRKKDLDD